jgi:hypothetical protein
MKKQWLDLSLRYILVILAIQSPLLAEFSRRFINPSVFSYLISDTFMFLTVVLVTRKNLVKNWGYQMAILVALLCYAIPSVMSNDIPAIYIYIGSRSFIMGLISAILGCYLVKSGRCVYSLIWMALCWSALISGYAVLQLVLGISHPINLLPDGIGNSEAGIGGYSELGGSMFGLFRPTSIFFHTGKFGQVAYFMALIPMLFLFSNLRSYFLLLRILTVLGFTSVLVSGQRAAFLFLIIAFAVYLLHVRSMATAFRVVALGLSVIAIPAWYGGGLLVAGIGEHYSGLGAVSEERFIMNSSVFSNALDKSGLFGEGVGSYSLGSTYFRVIRDAVTEHSWIRLLSEWGVFGFLIIFSFFLSVFFSCIKYSGNCAKDTTGEVLRFASKSIALSLAAWAFTHDVIGNTLTMQIAFTVFGATRGWFLRQLCCGVSSANQLNVPVKSWA